MRQWIRNILEDTVSRGSERTTNTVVQRQSRRKYVVENKAGEAEMNMPLA